MGGARVGIIEALVGAPTSGVASPHRTSVHCYVSEATLPPARHDAPIRHAAPVYDASGGSADEQTSTQLLVPNVSDRYAMSKRNDRTAGVARAAAGSLDSTIATRLLASTETNRASQPNTTHHHPRVPRGRGTRL